VAPAGGEVCVGDLADAAVLHSTSIDSRAARGIQSCADGERSYADNGRRGKGLGGHRGLYA
jgi:hypothetical protein